MVTKGNGNTTQAARGRRTPLDANADTDAAPLQLQLKQKAMAVPSDTGSTGGENLTPTSDASPTGAADRPERLEGPMKLSMKAYHEWTQRAPANPETSLTLSHAPHQRRTTAEQPWQRERERERDDTGSESARGQAEEGDGQGASTSLVTIAPAKPGAMLPKDLIMAKYRVKPDAPKFLLMLYEILQHECTQVIRWTDDGLALQILDQANVTEKVLPKYFNHTNFHSFQRQLNYFGFRKWTKSKTDICTFSHPYFRRNQPELMHLIKRKKATRRVGAGEQAELVYPTDGYAGAAATTASNTSTSPPQTSAGPSKKLLPLSPSGKRRLEQDASHDGESRGFQHANGSRSAPAANGASSSGHSNNHTHMTNSDSRSSSHRPFLASAATLTNAISPASGGAKKKAKTTSGNKSFHPPELAPSGPGAQPSMRSDQGSLVIPAGTFPKGALPNLDLVRNRLVYRQPPPGGPAGQMPGFSNGFPIAPNVNSQAPPSTESSSQTMSTSTPPVSNSSAPTTDSTSSMFNNSFSDPVDILLRIKKSRAMSQDNTIVQSPQQSHGQVEGFASLQNFLLSQSMYTNRLESQLKLAIDENDALRHLVDAKQREVEALLNERKMIQNENSVLTEDKNKLFEINRDLLSKLFPQ